MKVLRPWYGVPESSLSWYLTYLDHHVTRLVMKKAKIYMCLSTKHDGAEKLIEKLILLVDGTLAIGSKSFLEEYKVEAKAFRTKQRHNLSSFSQNFNGITLLKNSEVTIFFTQPDKIERMKEPDTHESFHRQRSNEKCIGVNVRPDICSIV